MAQYGIKEVMNFTLTNYHANPHKRRPLVWVDYAQVTAMNVNAERLEIDGGRGNGRLLTFDHSKTASFNLTLPLVDLKMLALISGDDVEQKIREIYKRDVLNIQEEDGRKFVELSRKPVEGSIHLYNLDNCRDIGDKICPALTEESVQLEEGQYIIDEENPKILWLHEDHNPETGTMIAYYHYKTQKEVTTMRINPEKFPRDVAFYGEALWRNQCDGCDEVYHVIGHRGKLLPEYELTMSGTDSAVLELTLEMMAVNDPSDNTPVYIEYIKDDMQDCYKEEDEDPCEIDEDGEIVEPETPEEPKEEIKEGSIETVQVIAGDNEDVNPFGALSPRIALGELGEDKIQVKDLTGMKVMAKKGNKILATNTLQMDKLNDNTLKGTEISCPFNLGRKEIDDRWAWVRGVYEIKGEKPTEEDLPNIFGVELDLKDGRKSTFSVNVEDKVKLPKPFEPKEITKKK